MKKSFLIFSFICVCLIASAQTNTIPKYTVPEEYSLVLPEDYTTYQPQIKEAIDWYLWRSIGLDDDRRQDASAFFMKWLVGSPTVTVDIDTDKIVTFVNTNPKLLLPFCMGWTRYSIENNSTDRIKSCTAAIVTVVDYYNKNRGSLNKDENVEKYEKMIKNNKLESFVSKNLPAKK